MESIEVSAKTVEDAILEAAIRLGTTRDKVIYEVITPGSLGFFGIGSKKAVIKARKKTEEEENVSLKTSREMDKLLKRVYDKDEKNVKDTNTEKPKSSKEERQQTKEEKPKKSSSEEAAPAGKKQASVKEENPLPARVVNTQEVQAFLDKIFEAMNMKVRITITQMPEENELDINLEGEDMGVLIGKRGQTLDSLQYLTSLVVNKGAGGYIRVKMDTENYRERRKATLENLAKNIAQKVKKTGKTVSLEPMNPYERRMIHSALQNDKFVSTHSEGEEPYRRVVVELKEGVRLDNYNGRGRNRYNRNYKRKER